MIYLSLFWVFLQIGLFSIGGGYAAIPLIQSKIVEENAWLTMTQFTDLITIAEMTPGPIAINSATFVGTHIAGVLGAIVSTIGFIVPAWVIVIILAFLYYKYKGLSIIGDIMAMLRPTVIALIASAGAAILLLTLWGDGAGNINFANIKTQSLILFVLGFAVLKKFKPNPVYIIAGAGIISVTVYAAGHFLF